MQLEHSSSDRSKNGKPLTISQLNSNSWTRTSQYCERIQQSLHVRSRGERIEFLSSRYKVGEAFLHLRHPQALKRLERDQEELDSQVSALRTSAEECERQMKALKVNLYAKFGRAINLDE